jgi:hypothetical protein
VFAPLRSKERTLLATDLIEIGFRADAILAGVALDDVDADSVAYADDVRVFAENVYSASSATGFKGRLTLPRAPMARGEPGLSTYSKVPYVGRTYCSTSFSCLEIASSRDW